MDMDISLMGFMTGLSILPNIVISADDNGFCWTPLNIPTWPKSLELSKSSYSNWVGDINFNELWTVFPKSSDDVIKLSNWAAENGRKLRPVGSNFNWSPLLVTKDTACNKLVLVHTGHFTSMEVVSTSPPTVRIGTGVTMQSLLEFLESHGLGLASHPAPGDITIGGVIAIGGHGAGIPVAGAANSEGLGSISNLIVSLKAIAWNNHSNSYELKTFHRNETETSAFLTNLGRTFLTEVTLRVRPIFNLQCRSMVDISMNELVQHPKDSFLSPNRISNLLESYSRIEIILFPFTTHPWVKLWKESPTQPLGSRHVTKPFNYQFADNTPSSVNDLLELIIQRNWKLTPFFGFLEYALVKVGLVATASYDIWGTAKNLLLYVKHSTLRVTASGYAVLIERSNIQLALNRIYAFYNRLLHTYQDNHLYPINGAFEIRIAGVDNAGDVGIFNAEVPALSACQPDRNHTELDTVIWMDVLTFPNTLSANAFFTEFENYLFQRLENDLGVLITVRSEWSKGWAYTNESAWANQEFLKTTIPNAYQDNWKFAKNVFNKYDPSGIFSNNFLDKLF